MAITTDINPAYGSPEVTNKYRPLGNIAYDSEPAAYYTAMLRNRCNLLTQMGMLPQMLALAAPNWAQLATNENGRLPPLVVVSSNRSNWIAQGIANANLQLQALGLAQFRDPCDLRALTASNQQRSSPPIYCPQRLGGANRSVFILVHASEYGVYKRLLNGPGITVIGWQFQPGNAQAPALSGFGASRFAAIAFCKELRRRVQALPGQAWNFAWLFDDNVVAINDFGGLVAVENAMNQNTACAAFKGGSMAETFLTISNWAKARTNHDNSPPGPLPPLPPSTTQGLIQQAALWNIDYLDRQWLNFAPVYVASAEDVSLGSYLDLNRIPYLYYEGLKVRKELASDDPAGNANGMIGTARRQMEQLFATAESTAAAAATPPPPVQVVPRHGPRTTLTLREFVVENVLKHCAIYADAGKPETQAKAACQAAEQITSGAIPTLIQPAALTAAFQVNGQQQQPISTRDLP